MSESRSTPRGDNAEGASGAEAVGDALRSAVERTLAATAGSATETRDRAQGLLDDVVRRGQSARERVAKRGEEATNRLADAIGELRAADGEDLETLSGRLDAVEARLRSVEGKLEAGIPAQWSPGRDSNPQLEVEQAPADPDDQRDSEV
jgi:polyhydroxyalkanoate synthesis regulator phasin